MIPCKECLLYAVCKHKEEIECKILYDWIGRFKSRALASDIIVKYIKNWKGTYICGGKWKRIRMKHPGYIKYKHK